MKRSPTPICLTAALIALALTIGCRGDRDDSPPDQRVQDGFATMDDGIRIYYRIVENGDQIVVIPAALYLADPLSRLADGRQLVFYDPRNRGRSDAADTSTISIERQVRDLDQMRDRSNRSSRSPDP